MTLQFSKTPLALFLFSAFSQTGTKAQMPQVSSSPKDLVDALHTAFGENHSRAVHAKGIILEGNFTPDPVAQTITKAAHLQKTSSKVLVRFSDFTGIPTIPDNSGLANPRGFAVKFLMADGSTTDIVGHSFNGFPTADSDQFRELLLAIGASGAEAAKPTALDRFLASHPIAKTFLTTQKNPKSFGTINYYGVNAFEFINTNGESVFVRYQFIPEAGEELISADEMANSSSEYLMTEIRNRISERPIKYKMYAQIAAENDVIENPAIAWPETRKLVLLGVLEIQKLADNSMSADKILSFIPNNLPQGIKPADPMIGFRSKAYPISVAERRK